MDDLLTKAVKENDLQGFYYMLITSIPHLRQ